MRFWKSHEGPVASAVASPPHEFDLGGALGDWLGRVVLAPKQQLGRLEISPLLLRGDPGEPFFLLHEAMASGTLEVTERGQGNVNEVVAHNRGDRPILILEGESIQGAKQNRMITKDVLIAAGSSVAVIVGCVEQGRWDRSNSAFRSSPMPVEPGLRLAMKLGAASGAKVDQARLWRAVSGKLAGAAVESSSRNYHDFMHKFGQAAEQGARALKPVEGQVGILATEDGRLVGMDLLGHPRNWGALSHRLASSYVLGSLDDDAALPAHLRRSPEEWLRAIAAAGVKARPSAGLGHEVVLSDPTFVSGGLWHEGRPAHLAAFGIAPTVEPGSWVAQV